MNITQSEYVASYPRVDLCPNSSLPEYAFIGRSNVGKSSLINMLTGRKNLAKTSGQPGKTQKLNYFLIDRSWYIVDLPGYGYAKISKAQRQKWQRMIQDYILRREQLLYLFLLIDGRIPPQAIDMEFITWLGISKIPFVIVFTKNDKPPKSQPTRDAFEANMMESWKAMPPRFVTCARNGLGKEPILTFIEQNNNEFAYLQDQVT